MTILLQVQKWLGAELNPLAWGWISTSQGLSPKMMARDAAPQHLLRMISCGCKKGCGNACSCRKTGLKCSLVCSHCSGVSCDNVPDIELEEDSHSPESDIEMLEDVLWTDLAEDMDDAAAGVVSSGETDDAQPGPSKRAKCTFNSRN